MTYWPTTEESFEAKSGYVTSSEACSLLLSDGSGWCLRGDQDNAKLLRKLATIMELKERAGNGLPNLIFCRDRNTNAALKGMIDQAPPKSYASRCDDAWDFHDHSTLRIWFHDHIPDVICEVKQIENPEIELINMWFALQPIYQQSIRKGGLPFHGGLVERDGRGFLLVASGGAGKSTCCRRLPEHWQPLCDDETLVVLGEEKKYRAHPFPTWSDYLWKRSEKTWNTEHSVLLLGVFFIEQSETDAVVPVGEGQAAVLMTESATQVCEKFWRNLIEKDEKRLRTELFNNACVMAKQIPAYRLCVSLKGRFWEKIEQVLGGE